MVYSSLMLEYTFITAYLIDPVLRVLLSSVDAVEMKVLNSLPRVVYSCHVPSLVYVHLPSHHHHCILAPRTNTKIWVLLWMEGACTLCSWYS